MTRNGRTDLSVKNRITLLQQKIIRCTKNRNIYIYIYIYIYEAKTAVLYGSITPKSLQLILIFDVRVTMHP